MAAGFADITAHVVRFEKNIGDGSGLARGLTFGSPVVDQIKARGGATPEQFYDALVAEFQRELGNPGKMPIQATVYSARKPG